jgi:hypothetical protein
MMTLALSLLKSHWRIAAPVLLAVALFGWQRWQIVALRDDKAGFELSLTACQDREKAAIAVARAAQADASARASDAARAEADNARTAKDHAEKVRKGIDHAEDGPVAPVLLGVIDGLRGK